MANQIIQLDNAPNQIFQVPLNLDGAVRTLVVTLRYNEIAKYWLATIKDNAGNLLLDSVPVMAGKFPSANILQQFTYLKIGSMYLLNVSGKSDLDYPNNTNLGTDFILVWGDTQPPLVREGIGVVIAGEIGPDGITDGNINLLTNWEKHVGPDIGGNIPTDYGWNQFQPPSGSVMEFFVTGGAFSDWLAANHRPVLISNVGRLHLSFKLRTDIPATTVAQAIEFDTKFAWQGWVYNFSMQLNYNAGGTLQISNQIGNWANTGFTPGMLTPGAEYQILCEYLFNTATRKYSYDAVTIGGTRYVIPGGLRNLDALNQGWADGAHLQVQEDTNIGGGTFSIFLDEIKFFWPFS